MDWLDINEFHNVRIDSKSKCYTNTLSCNEEFYLMAKTNADDGDAVEIHLNLLDKNQAILKTIELESHVENEEVKMTFKIEDLAKENRLDPNTIKEINAVFHYENEKYPTNKARVCRTLRSKELSDSGEFNDIAEGKIAKAYKKGKGTTPNSKGDEVKLIQTALQKMKINIGDDSVDGVFGNDGHNAVMTFQENYKPTHNVHQYAWVEPDGIVGKNTLLAMDEALVGGWEYVATETIWDMSTTQKITSLHPNIRDSAKNFILDAQNQKIYLKITSAYRSIEEQNNLYLKGRTLKDGKYSKIGKTVTNAKGGESYHNFGLAIDIVEIKNKKALWDNNWEKLGIIGKKHGFEWGGEWTKFKDKPHFQMTFGNNTKTLLKKIKNKEMENGYVKL